MEIYNLRVPSVKRVPILLSIPHSGTFFPSDLVEQFKGQLLPPDDTDWFVDRLYDFATALGITVISANYSRWIIDLNRDPQAVPLYNDGRLITGLCPTTDFLGLPIYNDERSSIDAKEIERRTKLYFEPYQEKIQHLLDDLKAEFGAVMLWDCHSIRRFVPTIRSEAFPDLILGSAEGSSASDRLITSALKTLSESYDISYNEPFKGGFITRSFGKPEEMQHALQLEMCKDIYMDQHETEYDDERANKVQAVLKNCLNGLLEILMHRND